MPLPSWAAATAEDWLGKTAMNLMLIGVAARKIGRVVRLPEGPLPRVDGDGTSKSAASRRFVALSQQRLEEWLASDISELNLLVIQIDGLHLAEDIVLIGAIGIDGKGDKHILGLVEGATENAAAGRSLACTNAIREHAGHDPPRNKEREALARCVDGSAMGCGRHVGGDGRLPSTESLPSAPGSPSSAGRAPVSPP